MRLSHLGLVYIVRGEGSGRNLRFNEREREREINEFIRSSRVIGMTTIFENWGRDYRMDFI